jgi:hypothetical protein
MRSFRNIDNLFAGGNMDILDSLIHFLTIVKRWNMILQISDKPVMHMVPVCATILKNQCLEIKRDNIFK